MEPDDAEFRSQLAYALYRNCRFEEARAEASKTLELDATIPDAHYTTGLVAERAGEFDEADLCFARANEIDGKTFPRPLRLSGEAFEKALDEARGLLNETFRKHLDGVTVTVEALPDEAVLREANPPMDPELLGLFVGVPLADRSNFSPGGELPPRILVFKRNLERTFPDPKDLREEIGRTLHHELGHYLGLDEDEHLAFLEDLGISTPAVEIVIQKAYKLLGLMSFLTAAEPEVRAWTIKRGTVAQKAAGVIHSDIERGFIRAEVTSYDDYIEHKTPAALKAAGKQRLEGKEYRVKDGDVILFRFNV